MAGKYVTGPMTIKEFEERKNKQYTTGPTTIGEFESAYRDYKNEIKQKQDSWDRYLRDYVNNVQYRNTYGSSQPFNRQQQTQQQQGPTTPKFTYVTPKNNDIWQQPTQNQTGNVNRPTVTGRWNTSLRGTMGVASMGDAYAGKAPELGISDLEQIKKQTEDRYNELMSQQVYGYVDPTISQQTDELKKQIDDLQARIDNMAEQNNSWLQKPEEQPAAATAEPQAKQIDWDKIQNTKMKDRGAFPKGMTERPDDYNDNSEMYDRMLYDFYYGKGEHDKIMQTAPNSVKYGMFEDLRNLWSEYDNGRVAEAITGQNPMAYQSGSEPERPKWEGMLEPGNIDLDNRPVVQNADGSISTERSFSANIDGEEVLLPTVIDGVIVSEDEAINHYYQTGEHLGKFDTPENANNYAEWLHNRQEEKYGNPELPTEPQKSYFDFLSDTYSIGGDQKDPSLYQKYYAADDRGKAADEELAYTNAKSYINAHAQDEYASLDAEKDYWNKVQNTATDYMDAVEAYSDSAINIIQNPKMRERRAFPKGLLERPDDYNDNQEMYDRMLYDFYYGKGEHDKIMQTAPQEIKFRMFEELRSLWNEVDSGRVAEAAGMQQNLWNQDAQYQYQSMMKDQAEKELEQNDFKQKKRQKYLDLMEKYKPGMEADPSFIPENDRGGDAYRDMYELEHGSATGATDVHRIYSFLGAGKEFQSWAKILGSGGKEPRISHEYSYAMMMDNGVDANGVYHEEHDEIKRFMSLYNEGKYDEAKAFIEGLQYELKSRYSEIEKINFAEAVRQMPVLSNIAAIMSRQASTYMALPSMILGAFGVEDVKDPNSWINAATKNYAMITEETQRQLQDQFGSGAAKTYQVFMQSVSDVINGLMSYGGGGSGLAQRLLGYSSFASQVYMDQLYRNLETMDYTKASTMAIIDAVKEVVEELLPFETMLGSEGKGIVRAFAENALSNAGEELAGNTVIDQIFGLFTGENKEKERRNEIVAQNGYYDQNGEWIPLDVQNDMQGSIDEAYKRARNEYLTETAEGTIAGLAGGGFGSAYSAVLQGANMINTGRKVNSKKNNVDGVSGGEKLLGVAEGMTGTESQQQAQKIRGKLENGGKLSNYDVGKLAATMMEETNDQVKAATRDTLVNRIKLQLKDAGLKTEVAGNLANIMADGLMNDGKLSLINRNIIAKERAAIDLWKDYTSKNGSLNQLGANIEIAAATKDARSLQEDVMGLLSKGGQELENGIGNIIDGAETADKAEVKKAGGSKGTGSEVLADGKIIDIGGIEMRKNADGEEELMLIPKDGGEAIAAADAKAVDENMAKAMQFFTSDGMKTASSRFANVIIENIKNIRDIGAVMSDALKVRMDTMFGKTGTKTNLSGEMVEEIRNATMEDFNEAEEKRIASQKEIKPGQGTTTFNGAQFGTTDFAEAIKGLAKNIRQEAYAIGEIARAAGFDVKLIYDEANTKMQGWFSTDSGVTINLAGENVGGEHHNALVTFAHEITHWLEANSREAYARLRSFIFDSLEKAGVNLTQRAQDIIANYQNNNMDIDLNGAMAEMVAQGCDQILTDESVIANMKQSDPTLFGNIRKAVQNLLNRVRSAISRMKGSMSYESRNLQGFMDRIGKLWNLAYDEARGQVVAAEDTSGAAASLQASVQDYAQHRKQTIDIRDALKNPKKYNSYFTYDNLIKKDPIQAVQLNQIDINKTRADIMNEEMASAIKNGRKKGDFAYVKVYDIGTEIRVGKRGLRHSLDHLRLSQPIAEKLGEVLKESVLINTADGRVNGQVGNYYLLGAGRNSNGKGITYALFTINKYTAELEDVDFMYAMRTTGADVENNKKPDANMAKVPANNSIPLSDFNVNIAKALNDVKDSFANVLPENVLERFGIKRENIQDDNKKYLQHSIQDNIYDEAGKDAELQRLKAEAEKYRKARDSARSKYDSIIKSDDMKAFNDRIAKAKTDEENDRIIEDMLAWQEENDLDALKNELADAENKLKEAQKAYDSYQEQALQKTEQQMIKDSGMTEADWRRKQAINQYGYTGDYREAGYLLPNGRMLNFTGSKGQHYGMRGNDHRDIGIVYATKQGSEAMNAFMSDGNIRVMAETPGVDIVKEPTTAQYKAIMNMAYRFAGEEYFSVDFSDERGNNIGNLEYDGHVNPTKVINDIRTFFRTGAVPQQSVASMFHYSVQDDAAYMDAVKGGDAQAAQDYVDAAAKANGYTITAFHGTGRADRVGTVFLPERATSGPMAFFTDSREIAENYARDKQDTSIAYDEDYGDYYNQFRVTLKNGQNVPVGKLWNTLSFAERQKITENAKHITLDDDAEEIIYDRNAQNGVGNFNDYERKLHGWNSIDTLIDGWLESGTLWDREGDFLKVLELAGIKNVTWNDPNARHEKVYDTYLKIQNPFDTGTMYTNEFLDDLAKWWKKQDHAKYEQESAGADFWDKRSITVDDWIDIGRTDIEANNTHNWTRIPDGVTAYLQAKGYDGIKDQGGKGGGAGHTVWIPFSSEQIKSAETYTYDDQGNIIPPSERFNSENRDIRYSIQDIGDQEASQWMQSVNPASLQTEAEKMLLNNFRSLQMRIDLKREQIENARKQIREIERTPESERTQEQKRMLRNLNVKMQNATTVRDQAINELARITGSKGYARMMREQNRIFNNFIYGKTQEDVRQAVTQMDQSVDAISKRIEQNQKDIAEIEKEGSISRLKKALGTTTADKAAGELKKEFHSSWTRSEIRNFLDPILVKMANGEDFSNDVQELADILISSDERNVYEGLSELRGLRITIGHGMMQELRAQDSSLKEIRRRLAGTGISVRAAQKVNGTWEASTLEQDIESLRAEYPNMPDFGNEKDALENFVRWVEGMKQQNGVEFYNEKLADTMAVVMQKAAGVAHGIYIPTEAKAQKQVLELIDYVRGLNAKTDAAEKALRDIAAEMARMKQANAQAIGMANILTQNVGEALRYYDRTAKLAMDTARVNKQSAIIEQLKSKQAEKILKNNEEWRNLIERDRQARVQADKNAQRRSVINTDIKRMYRLLRDQSATKNMPEYMQALARATIDDFVSNDLSGQRILKADQEQLTEAKRLLQAWNKQNGAANYGSILDNLEDAEEAIGQALMLDRDTIYQTLIDWNSDIKGKNKLDILQKRGEILDRMQKAVSEIYNAIQAERTVQVNKRRVTTQNQAYKVMTATKGKRYKEWTGKAGGAIRTMRKMIVSGNMTPEYFFRTIGNEGLNDLWQNYHDAENRNGLELHKAQERLKEIADRHGYGNWDMNQKLNVDIGRNKVEMTLGQMMSLWATWKRENTLGPAMSEHLTKGGFYAEQDTRKGFLGREEVQKRAYRVNEQDMQRVEALLSDEQRAFVDEVVGFMSNEMSQLGNEASMAAYGIKLYKEDYYFPFKMWDGIKNRKSNDSGNGANIDQAFHPSFSKTRLHGANNALVIGDFMQTASDHIAGMINYATMGLANDSLQKVLNEKMSDEGPDGEPTEGTIRNIRAVLEEAYGREAMQYLAELQKQLNGGAVRIEKTVYDKAISLFRKNAVAGSLSVAAQQPLSYIRAATMINTKYLAKALGTEYWKGSYQELLKHSGVAVIKEMGRFDMNAGQSAREYLQPDGLQTKWKKAWDQITDKATILPEKMDAWTWTRMWVAVKQEQHAEHPEMDIKSDEFLDMCGERFNDIMRRTQVYDSVLVRSENMRSQNPAIKSITSFMAEPTLTLNVLADAVRSAKAGEAGGKALLAKAGATFLLSAALQAAVKALFSTGRSPDDKKTWLENWMNRFTSNMISEVDPVQLIPGYSDLITLLKDGKLEDDAMGAIGKLFTAGKGTIDVLTGNGKNGLYRDLEDSAGQLTQLFTNLPAKNIMRDLRAMYNWFIDQPYAKRENNANVMRYQFTDSFMSADNMLGVVNKWLGEAGYDTSNTGYKKRVYEAIKKGDEKQKENLIDYLMTGKGIKDQKSINSAVKGYIKEDYENDKIDRKQATDLMKKTDPGIKEKDITKALDEIEYEKETGEKVDSFSVYMPIYDAIDKNDSKTVKERTTHLTKNGYTEKDVNDQIKTYILKQFKEGKYTKAETEKKLKSYRPDISAEDVWWTIDLAEYKNQTGDEKASGKGYRLKAAINANSANDIREAINQMTKHGIAKDKIKSQYLSDWKKVYLEGDRTTRRKIRDALQKAYKILGYTAEDANKTIDNWEKSQKKNQTKK